MRMRVVTCYEFRMIDMTDIAATHMLMDTGCMRQLTASIHKLKVAVSYVNFDIMERCKLNHQLTRRIQNSLN